MEYVVYFFPFLFVGMFILVIFILSKKGWVDLVSHYHYTNEFIGERVGIISASINGVNYNNCLTLKYNSEGIYLRPILFFRLFHKPVLIPWKEIKGVRDKKILFFSFKELVIGDPFVAVIGMKKSTFERIENYLPDFSQNRR